MKILFRVDAGNKIGVGHFYRSLSLAQQLEKRGHEVIFTHLKSTFWDSEIQNGFPFKQIELDSLNSENQTYEFISKQKIQVFYVDGIIDFNEDFIDKIKKNVKVVFYQNLSASKVFADIFILPSIHQEDIFFQSFSKKTKIYRGLEFFTFNPLILKLEQKEKLNQELSIVAVAAGGSDPNNTLLAIYKFACGQVNKNIKFVFYFGKDFLHKKSIPSKLPNGIQFHLFNHTDILKHDLLITAFGVSTYEFLYLGMPILSYGHQESNARASNYLESQTNSLISLGEISKLSNKKFESAFVEIEKFSIRKKLTSNAKKMLDLNGTKRIVKIIEDSNLT